MQKDATLQDKELHNLIALLKQAQEESGYVKEETMAELAASLDLPVNYVYGVASFYSFISTRPLGRNVIRICQSLPCYLKNCQTIVESVEKETGLRPGETTPDGRFSFQLTNCIGACDRAPAMLINNDVHTDLTPEKISRILKDYK